MSRKESERDAEILGRKADIHLPSAEGAMGLPKDYAKESSGIFIDGSRVTPGTAKCMCDSPEPRPDGRPRDCEFPCWQRLGLTTQPCCPDCAPLGVTDDQ